MAHALGRRKTDRAPRAPAPRPPGEWQCCRCLAATHGDGIRLQSIDAAGASTGMSVCVTCGYSFLKWLAGTQPIESIFDSP